MSSPISEAEEVQEHKSIGSSNIKAEETPQAKPVCSIDAEENSKKVDKIKDSAEGSNDIVDDDLKWDPDFKQDPKGPVVQYDRFGTPHTTAIMKYPTPTPPGWDEIVRKYQEELRDAPQMLINEDFIGESKTGPPHEEPVEGSDLPQSRKIGRIAHPNFEMWEHGVTKETYYYNRERNETKWWFTRADFEAEIPGSGKYWKETQEEMDEDL